MHGSSANNFPAYSTIHCDLIIINLQRKSKIGEGIRKKSSDQQFFVLTSYVYHFPFRNCRLAKVLFIHCLYIVFFSNQRIKAIKKTNFNDSLTPKPVKIDKPCRNGKRLNFDACLDTGVSFLR